MCHVVSNEMLSLFKSELSLCKVHDGGTVAILTAGSERPDYVQAFMLAAQTLGAHAFHVDVPRVQPTAAGVRGRHALVGNQPAINALKQADLVIDMLGLLFSKEQAELQAAGCRILRVAEPFHVLKQMFPTEDLRRRVEVERELLLHTKVIHVTSPGGTDVQYRLSHYPVIAEYGYTDEPGRWDHFPSGFAFTQAGDGDVSGVVMLMPGDILCAFKRYVQSPVRLTVKDGYIVDINGDGMDAALIRQYIDSFEDPRGYAISHIGWGLNERAKWHQLATSPHAATEYVMNALSFYGNVLFSTGPNTELGGSNDTPCHLDMPLRGCSLWVDGLQVLHQGDVVHANMRASPRQR